MANDAVQADVPQTEREWIMELRGDMKSLTESINGLKSTLERIEIRRIEPLEKKVAIHDRWISKAEGAIKAVYIVGGIVATVLGAFVYELFKKVFGGG